MGNHMTIRDQTSQARPSNQESIKAIESRRVIDSNQPSKQTVMNPLVHLVTMDFPYALETVCVAMAIQGSMAVRNGPNRKRTMNWFHSFVRSTLTAYAGG